MMHAPYIRLKAVLLLATAIGGMSSAVIGSEPSNDVPTYRGDPARTGVMPGPGPTKDAVVAWRFEAGAPIVSQAAVIDDTVYVVSAIGSVHALELATGTEIWRADARAPSRASPTVSSGLVIVATSDGVVAFDRRDGYEAWSTTATGPVAGTPAVVDATVIAASEQGMISAIDAGSGGMRWRSDAGMAAANSVAADPASGIAVIAGKEGVAVAVDLADGHPRWRYDTHEPARIGTPTIAGGLVFVATLEGGGPGTRHIHAVDAATGERRWLMDSPGDAPAFAPAVIDGLAVISGEDGSVTAVDARTGHPAWRYDAPGVVETVPAVVDGSVYVASNGGQALALDLADGTERWRVPIEGVPYGVAVTAGLVIVGTTTGTLYAIGSMSGIEE
jgi:eukaryotic-like serine/threonine-protein kinase